MQARDLMTTDVVSVSKDTPIRDVARLLLQHHVSAAPVVDAGGMVVGMVSEGDLVGRSEIERAARRDWWLALLAEGEELHPDFVASLRSAGTAGEVMSAPVIRVVETTEAADIAALLAQYRIKRVPVVRDGKLVGIVSRADLLRALAAPAEPDHTASPHRPPPGGLFADAIAALDRRFFSQNSEDSGGAGRQAAARPEGGLNVTDFRLLMADFANRKAAAADAAQRDAAADRRNKVAQLIDEHVRDESWQKLLHQAREVAERGEKEFLLLRFPSELCIDRGRAINAAAPDWPRSLRGEAAEIYLRWESELKPRGFHLIARVLDFPGGMPGDIGLFLGWGE